MTQQQFLTTVYKNEDQFTAAVHKYINHNYPELRGFYFHVANESATNKLIRIKLHSMGLLAGCPDFCFIYPKLWFLELKMQDGKLSDKQKKLHKLWKSKGIIVKTAYTPDEVIDLLIKHL
jgi:hypothetical protein